MFVEEGPWRHNEEEGKCSSNKTKRKRKLDILLDITNDKTDSLGSY
jgi:hypothetical protein